MGGGAQKKHSILGLGLPTTIRPLTMRRVQCWSEGRGTEPCRAIGKGACIAMGRHKWCLMSLLIWHVDGV